jgi:glutamine amidotransferase
MSMCELFAMSASAPTDVNHSLSLLKPRGGEIGPHADGWGVAFYEGHAARIFKEPAPAAESRCLAFITEYDFKSETVIAHIRKANPVNVGRASANTHPFEREWNGRSFVFAHNGKLSGLHRRDRSTTPRFLPLGDTDSELAFCFLMEAIAGSDLPASSPMREQVMIERIGPVVEQLAGLGEFNFLLSDGESLIAHAHTRLHALSRVCTDKYGRCDVVLIATSPLTGEAWSELTPGSIHIYRGGREITPPANTPSPPKAGRQANRTAANPNTCKIGDLN